MTYLLDTCTFLWLTTRPDQLSRNAAALIEDPANALALSDVSVWELSLKASAGKLKFEHSLRSWIPQKRAVHKLVSLPLNENAIYLSGELPDVHRDPFDRLLAAQAIESGMTMLSPDKPLTDLGASRIW
jgi:PIN domain nuclease of toxin-antitoxin system